MKSFLILFLIGILFLIIVLVVFQKYFKTGESSDSYFYDENGNHFYYDRSKIKKEKFLRDHPDIPANEIRSLKKLFKLKHKS